MEGGYCIVQLIILDFKLWMSKGSGNTNPALEQRGWRKPVIPRNHIFTFCPVFFSFSSEEFIDEYNTFLFCTSSETGM